MEPRARRQALRLHLAEARSALDRGDRQAARESVEAALDIDPEYLAAQALRDRIEEVPPGPHPRAEAPAALPAVPPVAVSAEGWARFEQRARLRRLEKRSAAARDAIAHGRFDEARLVMNEIREIDAEHPELISLKMEWDAATHQASRPTHWGPLVAAVAAFCALLLGARYLESPGAAPRPVQRAAAAPPAQEIAPQPVTAAPAGPLVEPAAPPTPPAAVAESTSPGPEAAARPDNPRADDTHVDAGEPIATTLRPRSIEQSPAASKPVPERPTPRDAATRPVFETPRFNWPPSPTADPGASAIQTVSQLPAPRPPEIEAPAVTTAALPIDPAALPDTAVAAARPPAVSAAAAAPADIVRPQARDEDLVRGVLQQYRLAYEHLDARSAQAVWPRVDGTALQRAFEELASQRLTFDACDVQVRSSTGTAVCRGSARYVPKVGSREPRVEPRVWTFALRKVGEDWRIDTARAEQ